MSRGQGRNEQGTRSPHFWGSRWESVSHCPGVREGLGRGSGNVEVWGEHGLKRVYIGILKSCCKNQILKKTKFIRIYLKNTMLLTSFII